MNIRPNLSESDTVQALSVAFNQDNSCFSVGLPNGFAIFQTDPCSLQVSRTSFSSGLGAVQMLGRSNYLALVGGGRTPAFAQNKVIIWNDDSQKKSTTLEFRSTVKAVRLSRNRIIVVLANSVHVYAFSHPPERVALFETAENMRGICELSSRHLAFPGMTAGHVQLLDLATNNVSIIPAHASPLAALSLSQRGDILASASENGTLIRVFSTANSSRIAELRRGSDHANIYNISISPSSRRLAVTSDKSTLHIFDLPHGNAGPPSPTGSNSGASAAIETPSNAIPTAHNSVTPGGAGPLSSSPNRTSSPHPHQPHHSHSLSHSETENKRLSFLNRLPLLPRYFSSEWSFTSTKFEGKGKGGLGWTDDESVILVSEGVGSECRWEKFTLELVEVGGVAKWEVFRQGWKAYLEE